MSDFSAGLARLRIAGIVTALLVGTSPAIAKDYFLTIGGGYAPKGNQASMEANVIFFQELLVTRNELETPEHQVFFADGSDPGADVQCSVHPGDNIPRKVLAGLFDWNLDDVEYRDHHVPDVTGANHPDDIQRGLHDLAAKLTSGDRFFVYVTAHGGAAQQRNDVDTKIHCWRNSSIHASEFAQWLDAIPSDVPVIMVMAQCYCGGFAHTIFTEANQDRGLATGLRCGFFAQQHNLPAAGCRPDISNDREYSSYFWGAIRGQSRNGQSIHNADRDGDGRVSFAEAHIHAVLEGETIDIPLRCSDVLLQAFSKKRSQFDAILPAETSSESEPQSDTTAANLGVEADSVVASSVDAVAAQPRDSETPTIDPEELWDVDATLAQLIDVADFVNGEIMRGMAEQLDVPLTTSIAELENRARQFQRSNRGRRRGRGGSRELDQLEGELHDAVVAQWPELEKVEKLAELEGVGLLLEDLETEITSLDSYQQFIKQYDARAERQQQANQGELELVKMRRLIQAANSALLGKNLTNVATADVIERYHQMLAVEQGSL